MSSSPRVGLVLGAGGATGGAFHAAVLASLQSVVGWDARDAAVIVGTSAGSVAGTSLRAGLSPADIFARAIDRPISAAGARLLQRAGLDATPPPLRPERASRRAALAQLPAPSALARAAVGGLGARPLAVLATLVPDGQVSTEVITQGVEALTGGKWPDAPLWICAVRASTGRRVVFGAPGGDTPPLGDAVAASCAIPGFFQPVTINEHRYIDGGAHSPTNADVLAGDDARDLGIDLVIVSSPMSITGRTPRLSADQPMRRWSRALLDGEARRLRRRGVPIVAFQPTADDAAVMGLNAMDPSRRAPVAAQVMDSMRRRLQSRSTRERLRPIWA